MVQEHHARSLHWDFRLERDGVLVSWAVPKGLPPDPDAKRLAVHTEDHPLEYAAFHGTIPEGEYGAGTVEIWDEGWYECERWSPREVKVVLHGRRASGRYVLFQTDGRRWMLHRMDPAAEAQDPMPETLAPMLAELGDLPRERQGWAYEYKWDGVRAVAFVDGGRLRLRSRTGHDMTARYPELRELGEALGSRPAVLDGEIVALDDAGRPSFRALQPRMHVEGAARIRRLRSEVPVTYMLFDVVYLDGRSLLAAPYRERRAALVGLELEGPSWTTPPAHDGPGADVLRAAGEAGLEGVVAKRVDAPYRPGRRNGDWVKVKCFRTQEVVVGGWTAGEGRRSGGIGALLLGLPAEKGDAGRLTYIGKVGTGFTDAMLRDLGARLKEQERPGSPFTTQLPRADQVGVRWAKPAIVGEVRFAEWTRDGRMRHPSWRGLRPDKRAREVRREQ